MNVKIVTLPQTRIVGMKVRMSFANDRTGELWRSFMPRRREIINPATRDLMSVQWFDRPFDWGNVDPSAEFEKMAAVEVADFIEVPHGMDTHTIGGGLYAVFHYQGDPRAYAPTFQYIFGSWMPSSPYEVDHREHFEVLGEKYKNNHPDSEEDIWVPIRNRAHETF